MSPIALFSSSSFGATFLTCLVFCDIVLNRRAGGTLRVEKNEVFVFINEKPWEKGDALGVGDIESLLRSSSDGEDCLEACSVSTIGGGLLVCAKLEGNEVLPDDTVASSRSLLLTTFRSVGDCIEEAGTVLASGSVSGHSSVGGSFMTNVSF